MLQQERPIDTDRLNAFMGKVVGDMGAAISASLVFIGDRLGLYKALAEGGPLTAAELAGLTQTSEIYVREWLQNQAVSGYVEYDAATGRFMLPAEHAMALVHEDSPCFVQGGFQILQALYKAVPTIERGFRTGEGLRWGEQDAHLFDGTERFFRPAYGAHLVSEWIPALEGVAQKLEAGATVADIGCGHGASTVIMAQAFPRSRFFGFDNHVPSIERAKANAQAAGVTDRVVFATSSSQEIPEQQYDLVCFFDCLHDMGDPLGALERTAQMLKPDGTIMLIEPQAAEHVEGNLNPVARIYSAASVLCCTPNALATGDTALGTLAPQRDLEQIATRAGLTAFRKAWEDPFNRMFEIRR